MADMLKSQGDPCEDLVRQVLDVHRGTQTSIGDIMKMPAARWDVYYDVLADICRQGKVRGFEQGLRSKWRG